MTERKLIRFENGALLEFDISDEEFHGIEDPESRSFVAYATKEPSHGGTKTRLDPQKS